MPNELLRAISGRSAVLPTVRSCTLIVLPWYCTTLLTTTGAAYSSLRFGARTSFDVTPRRRRPSIGVCQVAPIFQLPTLPAVLYLVSRSARFRFASPQVADFSSGMFSST